MNHSPADLNEAYKIIRQAEGVRSEQKAVRNENAEETRSMRLKFPFLSVLRALRGASFFSRALCG
jgi:hypothetical protein